MMLPYDKRLKSNSRSLRSNMTDAEQLLWQRLRRKQINGWQFYRQKPIGYYIVDFYCAAAHLVVELDGSQHFEADHQRADQQRDAFLQSLGLRVLRFDNRQVLLETVAVVEVIRQIPPIPPFSKGGDGRVPSSTSIDSTCVGSTNPGENHALKNATNSPPSVEKPENLILPFEKPANPIPPFKKGGLGGINQNPALATEKMETGQ
jgi:very-short-patch-repair endonuclease